MDSQDLLGHTITHLFLPKRTPEAASPNLGQIEDYILATAHSSVSQAVAGSNFTELNGVNRMLETWGLLQPTHNSSSEEDVFVRDFIRSVSTNPSPSTIPVYIRKQNCTILIKKVDDGSLQLESFRAALPSQLVMSSVGPLSMTVPETFDVIQNRDILTSPMFAKALYQFAVNEVDISTAQMQSRGQLLGNARDVAEPFLISDWIASILAPTSVLTGSQEQKYAVCKKVRDQVTLSPVPGSSQLLPFHRSGIWLSIKVALHLELLGLLQGDQDSSKHVYKLLLLRILADVCKTYHDRGRSGFKFDLDLAAQMLAKMGRRVDKLGKLNLTGGPTSLKIELLKEQVLAHVQEVVSNLNGFMRNVCFPNGEDAPSQKFEAYLLPNRSEDNYMDALNHSIPFLSSYKEPVLGSQPTPQTLQITPEIQASLKITKYPTFDDIISGAGSLTESYLLNERIWLYNTECFMKTQLKDEQDPEKISQFVETYIQHSLRLYQGNPIGISQMILVVLKAVEILDRLATKDHPLLREYLSGIDCGTFDCLLLPHQDDMKMLNDTLDYFKGRNDSASMNTGIITGTVDVSSFAVRFASQDKPMFILRDEVLRETKENITKLYAELQKVRDLQAEIQNTNSRDCTSQQHHCPCRRCILVKVQNWIKQRIIMFERPLPKEEILQNAVIFEELIPQVISDLRNCLAILKFGLLDEPIFNAESNHLNMKWIEYGNLIDYLPWSVRLVRKTGSVINLGSRRLNTLSTHHNIPNILSSRDESFTVDNGMECIYGYSHSYSFAKIQPLTQLRIQCAFQIKGTNHAGTYLALQGYLQSYEHTQNEVIANQNACHGDLFLDEFTTFGSIRAGHRIQQRNLYREIASKVLSLGEEPVLALVLQTIWQIGPSGESISTREAHLDFEDDEFCSAFLEMLEKLVKENGRNYNHPLILLTAVVIGVRIFELNERMHEQCYKLLKEWRTVIRKWTVLIEAELMKDQRSKTLMELQRILLLVRLSSAFSYNFSTSVNFRKVMRDQEDICEWFHTISILNQDKKQSIPGRPSPKLSNFVQMLVTMGQDVTLRLHLETYAGIEPIVNESLIKFVSEKWSKAVDCSVPNLEVALKDKPNLILLKYTETRPTLESFLITFDFILGTFLVNGLPDGRLQASITEARTFKRYFREHTGLRVQKESDKVLRTIAKFHGMHYEFRMPQQGTVFIKEIWDDGTLLTLLDHEQFRNIFAPSFVDNYTHWFDVETQTLLFRRLPSHASDYDFNHGYKLIKSEGLNGWYLVDDMNQAFVMSVNSKMFREIAGPLEPIELSQNFNVLVSQETRGTTITAHLPRYNLRFSLVQRRLECLEYPGFHILGEGMDDTLIGLEQGLQLWNGSKRLRLIPNGGIHFSTGSKSWRQQITINLEELREPTYFVYEHDQVLNRLVASKSKLAWLHLAALHAVTSSSLPDPFTGVTGTEMAVRILQSAFVWSSCPYDLDCLRTLKFIKGLAPHRSYYGHHGRSSDHKGGAMEVVQWPPGLPSMAAYDGFEIIVDKLIGDSEKLQTLYYVEKASRQEDGSTSSDRLRLRSYFRHLRSYNQGSAVQSHYFSSTMRRKQLYLEASENIHSTKSGSLQLPAVSSVAATILHPTSRSPSLPYNGTNLFDYLRAHYRPDSKGSHRGPIQEILNMDFRTNWFNIYEMARQQQKSEEAKHHLSIVLCAMAYQNAPIHQILNLHYISAFADQMEFPQSPRNTTLEGFQKSTYQHSSTVTSAMRDALNRYVHHTVEFFDVPESGNVHLPPTQRRALTIASSLSKEFGSCASIPSTHEITSMLFGFRSDWVLSEINSKLHDWDYLAEPRRFAEEVQEKLAEIYSLLHSPGPQTFRTSSGPQLIKIGNPQWKCELQLGDLLKEAHPDQDFWEELNNCFENGRLSNFEVGGKSTNKEDFINEKVIYNEKAKSVIQRFSNMVQETIQGKIFSTTGLCPRTDPTTLLRLLGEGTKDSSLSKTFSGALAVIWTHLKRLNRCLLYKSTNQAVELERELANAGHENWSPHEYPEWLLLELELDIMIRPVQVEVALRMIKMPDGGNGIMQLNMGEGKTTVIVPMLCSTLAKGDKLCRVTVLGSIFNTNHATLSFAIGGLLNRRIYTIPCKRDMTIDGELVSRIHGAYQECFEMNGVVLTLPEFRLSFRLLAYDKILKGDLHLGQKLQQTENWLRENAKDVLDEADELLNVKYQLIYTIGAQAPVDGGDLRWVACQKLLKLVQLVGGELAKKYGEDYLEFSPGEFNDHPYQFTPIRLLDSRIHAEFRSAVADRVLEEIIWTKDEKARIKQFLTQEVIEKQELVKILKICEDSTDLLNKVLVISGYLRRGVLTLGLSKRWRVEYGVDEMKSKRQMAVPFRAKDVAAEKTEFGHPDLAILLTHLSYYYSGLNNRQLDYTLKLIKMRKGAEAIYRSWIQQIPSKLVPSSLSTLEGLNLKDSGQRMELYKMLRRHKSVIDFWLANKVFPKEAKEFPAKLVMTAWDLCYERQKHPITGFSGTNDTSILLPLPIAQQDLPSLLDTNKEMEGVLLRPENRVQRTLQMGVSCREILNMMNEDNLTVLIDAGALLLECSNGQLSSMWLDVNPELEAIIYFSEDNELMVKCRSSQGQNEKGDVPFELSSFKGRLDKCGVFLDDQHTRGTDIKFPVGVKACVTVGGRMRRDKLIQASMRMRKLGRGHSVSFYLSHEASGKIKSGVGSGVQITTAHLLDWVSKNTRNFNEDGLLYWSIAGKNYAQRLAAEDNFTIQSNANILGEQCKDVEVIKLLELYGKHIRVDLLVNIIPNWFDVAMLNLEHKNNNSALPSSVRTNFNKIRDGVVARCHQQIPTKTHLFGSSMEEEQERELEPEKEMEIEEEVQIERRRATPAPHKLHENVMNCVIRGVPVKVMDGIERVCDTFRRTTFWGEVQPEGWGDEIYATTDFITVIADKDIWADSYLRPVEYIALGLGCQALLLSPFEVNELMPEFRKGQVTSNLHMFSPRRSEKQDVLLNELRLCLPPGGGQLPIPEESRTMAGLLLASGNLYFRNMEEQRAFALFVSLAPQPWTDDEKNAFDNGLITKTSFMMPHYRIGAGLAQRIFAFSQDPSSLIRRILTSMHPVLSEMAHVIRLLDEKVYVTFP